MADEPGEAEVGDRFHDEAIVQFLRLVDFVTAGIAARRKPASHAVRDPLLRVRDSARVAIALQEVGSREPKFGRLLGMPLFRSEVND